MTAVNGAPLIGATRSLRRRHALALCFGLSLLSAGTPMFFMGEEIGAQKQYTFDNFLANREDILGRAKRQRQGALSLLSGSHHSQPPTALDPQPQYRHPPPVEPQSRYCLQAVERRRGSHCRRESQQHVAFANGYVSREGFAGDSQRWVEGDLQQRCCDLWRPERG